MIDYFKVLRVPCSASIKEIKTSYLKLALQVHPDVNKSQDAANKFKLLNEAYEYLK
jgi:molecular chaperone DnaJ